MNTTDNAFIKAYAEELAVALGRPAKQVDRRKNRLGGTPQAPPTPTPSVSLSGLYAAPVLEAAAAASETPIDVQAEVELRDVLSSTVEVSPPAAYPWPSSDQALTFDAPVETTAPIDPVDDATTRRRLDPADTTTPPQWHAAITEWADPGTSPMSGDRAAPSQDRVAHLDPVLGDIPEAPSNGRDTFRPQWEVDGFRWPASVDRLVNEYTDWLNDVLDRLVIQAQQGSKVTAITGYARSEGRTTLALSLARLAARRGMSVVLVDGDHENPQIAPQLGLSFDAGWNQRGGDPSTLSEVAVQSIEDQLTVLPMRGDLPAGQSVGRDHAAATIAGLSSEHDLLLVDAGPMFTAARYWFDRQTDPVVDGALVVRDVRTVTDQQLTDVVQRLNGRGIPIVGIAENFESESAPQSATPSKLAS